MIRMTGDVAMLPISSHLVILREFLEKELRLHGCSSSRRSSAGHSLDEIKQALRSFEEVKKFYLDSKGI